MKPKIPRYKEKTKRERKTKIARIPNSPAALFNPVLFNYLIGLSFYFVESHTRKSYRLQIGGRESRLILFFFVYFSLSG